MTSPLLSQLAVLLTLTLGDGCILVAVVLAATIGGNPLKWGIAFGICHALGVSTGLLVAGQIFELSEIVGHIFTLIVALYLLRTYVHHTVAHRAGGGCSCDKHPENNSFGVMLATALPLSSHAMAAGPLLTALPGSQNGPISLVVVPLISALFVGSSVALLVYLGESHRSKFQRIIDTAPALVTIVLGGIAALSLIHLIEHTLEPEPVARFILELALVASVLVTSFWVYKKTRPQLVRISRGA